MRQQNRKLIYLAVVAALLFPLAYLGLPASRAGGAPRPHGLGAFFMQWSSGKSHPGGVLAYKRDEYRLGQANLGKIDPASETIKLATFGMRGLAASLLLIKAEDYKEKKDWTRLSAAYQQIAYLMPNVISTWEQQAFNLSFNVAHEFDDYRQRYQYAIRGIEFLEDGLEYNENDPRLLARTGWFAMHKIGRSDEKHQFRKLFRNDDDFHNQQSVHERDNFLFGEAYFRLAERSVEQSNDLEKVMKISMTPPLFYSRTTMAQAGYATALEDDHLDALQAVANRGPEPGSRREAWYDYEARFGEIDKEMSARILAGWRDAATQWRDYAQREFVKQGNIRFRLQDLEVVRKQRDDVAARLNALAPSTLRDTIKQEKRKTLSNDEREALDIPPENRTTLQSGNATLAESKIDVSHAELAARIEGAKAEEARKLGAEAMRLEAQLDAIKSTREIVNFDYWRKRAQLEQESNARDARLAVHRATVAYNEGDLVRARRFFEESFELWRKVVDAYPILSDDPSGLLMIDAIHRYEHTLKLMDEPFPENFILDVLRNSPMAQ